jgi:hypothetical protein
MRGGWKWFRIVSNGGRLVLAAFVFGLFYQGFSFEILPEALSLAFECVYIAMLVPDSVSPIIYMM